MKIGVMSDSHGNRRALEQALQEMSSVDLIFHLGDCVGDALYLKTLSEVPVHFVKGNMDVFMADGQLVLETMIGGFHFLACHGHQYGVKQSLNKLYDAGSEKGVQVLLYGHTHRAHIEKKGGMLVMNPGSVGAPRGCESESYGLITIENGDIKAEIIPLYQGYQSV